MDKITSNRISKMGCENSSKARQKLAGKFSVLKKTGPNFRANFGTDFGKISGPDFVKFRDLLRARFRGLLWPPEKAGNPSAPVRPWVCKLLATDRIFQP